MKDKKINLFADIVPVSTSMNAFKKHSESMRSKVFSFIGFIALLMLIFPNSSFGQTLPGLPLDFESGTVNYTFTDFDGGAATTMPNPVGMGINTSANIGKMVKNAGQIWGGSWIGLASPIDFSVNKIFKVKVFMPRIGAKLLLKVENATDAAINFQAEVAGTVANDWEELSFDFSGVDASKQYQHLVLIFDLGTMGDGSANFTYLFDDIKLTTGSAPQQTQMDLPVTFDLATVKYGLVGFGGADASTIADDPVTAGNKVAKVIKSATAELWAGTTVTALNGSVAVGFANKIPFTATDTKMSVRVYSPDAGIHVRLKVEDYTNAGITVETEALTTVANSWETLTFDFANQATGTAALNIANNYNKASIFFNFGVTGAIAGEKTYYFDDMKFISSGPPQLSQMDLPVTFDLATVNYGLVGFGGAEGSSIVSDPVVPTNKVAKVIKTATAELWAGTTVTAMNGAVGTGFANKIPFTATDSKMSVRVYSPDAGIKVRMKVEDYLDATKSVETEATTTVANTWETLTFDFSVQATGTAALNLGFNYNKASIFFNFGVTGSTAGEKTYFFDDMKFVGSAPPQLTQMDLPVTFDLATVNYGLVGFGGADNSTIVADPVVPTNKVAKVIKTATAELWAGTTVTALVNSVATGFANKIPFTATEAKMTVRVYSPDAGIKVRVKVEDYLDATKSVETEATTTVANTWETLTFDFSVQATGTAALNLGFNYNKASIFFNFGVTGATAGEKTYYFDDMKYASATPPQLTQMDLPVTFDLATVNYGLVGFGGAEGSSIVADPTLGTNKVAKVIKTATAESWAGTTVTAMNGAVATGFATKIPFTATNTKMTVRVYSPDAGIKVRLKVEDYLNAGITVETEAATTVANAWENLTFDFANQATGTAALNLANSYNKASIFFNFGVTGATAGEKTYYFDDMKFASAPPPPTGPVLPLDFESATLSYTFTDFDGGAATKVANPQISGINTSANVGKMVKNAGQIWAGSWINLDAPIDFSTNKTFKVKVYMPKVGSKLLLKVENATNSAISFESSAIGTVANAWEELTFDYSAIDATKQYQHLVFIFDLGTAGDGSANFTYLFDDVKLTSAPPPPPDTTQMNLPVTFELAYVNYGLVGFGGADNSTIVVDPTNSANKVAKVIKSATAELWAGTTVTALKGSIQTGFRSSIPFTPTEKRMNVRVWSPDAGIKVRIKVEDFSDPTKCVETEATSTVANAWETLTFDFANQATGTAAINLSYNYNKASIFFNFGVTGATAGEKTYYFDDMRFGAAPTAVKEEKSAPKNFSLDQNYPNPFNPSTTISYSVPFTSNVKLAVYNLVGEMVAQLVNGTVSVGNQEIRFDASKLSSGVYFYTISASSVDGKQNYQSMKKMILLK